MKNNKNQKKSIASKMNDEYFGLPHGEKDTPQLRRRFKNYIKRGGKWAEMDKSQNFKLIRDNNFYEFNKPEYDN